MKQLLLIFAIGMGALLSVTSSSSAQVNGGRPFSTTLTGEAEVPGPGDPDGSGEAFVALNQGRMLICFQISVTGISPAIAAHIHEAVEGEAGPIVVTLQPPDADGFVNDCVSVDADEIKEIRQHPEEYYINVHTADFPNGAVRGQLSK